MPFLIGKEHWQRAGSRCAIYRKVLCVIAPLRARNSIMPKRLPNISLAKFACSLTLNGEVDGAEIYRLKELPRAESFSDNETKLFGGCPHRPKPSDWSEPS